MDCSALEKEMALAPYLSPDRRRERNRSVNMLSNFPSWPAIRMEAHFESRAAIARASHCDGPIDSIFANDIYRLRLELTRHLGSDCSRPNRTRRAHYPRK
jgi:hypothetical protein